MENQIERILIGRRQEISKVPQNNLKKRLRPSEFLIQGFLFLCGALSILTTVGIVYELGKEALLFFGSPQVGLWEFFTGTRWQPQAAQFGILPLVAATLMTTLIAMLVAIPLGLSVAIYLSEFASSRVRSLLKPILEVLAGIPTVVYGYFALTFMTPFLRAIFGRDVVDIYNTASAGLVMGILILPLISSMSEDALSAVPRSLREASYALGATRLETALKVVLPAAISGLSAALIIGLSRAIGETMIVAIAAGAGPNFTLNPFKGAETMTGHIVRISGGDLSYDSIDYNSLFAIGSLLFFITLLLNLISQRIVRRYREVYE
jgi:phosphate transport system permease protein